MEAASRKAGRKLSSARPCRTPSRRSDSHQEPSCRFRRPLWRPKRLAAATAWLGPAALSAWQAAHADAGRGFLRSCERPLAEAIETAERGLQTLLEDERAHTAAPRALAWLDADSAARKLYLDYLGAA